MSTPNSVILFSNTGTQLGSFSTIAAAVGAASLGNIIAVESTYTGINGAAEMVTINVQDLRFGVEAGGPKPTLLLGPGIVSVIVNGDGDIDIFDDANNLEATSEIMIGNDGINMLDGFRGDDILVGGGGNDQLFGADGADALVGGDGNDQMQGESGNDNMDGGSGNDNMLGGTGVDFMQGGTGNDSVFGNEGTDIIEGGAGADFLVGGADADWLLYTNSPGAVNIDLNFTQVGFQTASGSGASEANGDSIQGFENVSASNSADTLIGNQFVNLLLGNGGNDTIDGNGGDDILTGNDGNDRLSGGSGNDILFGQAGADTFAFEDGDELAIIVDFTQGVDTIEISAPGINNIGDLSIGPGGADLVIDYGGDLIVLLGLSALTLNAGDFDFV